MNATSPRPEWRLPAGVPRALWDLAHTDHARGAHDERFSHTSATELDETILAEHLHPPGLVVDLGCGSGRLALPLARRGFRCLAVDLSRAALATLGAAADREGLAVDRLSANLVELGCLRDGVADYCIAMYSTLGMIRGRDNRLRFLRHVRRILRPGGTFVVHVHNRWYNLFQPQSRRWLLLNLLRSATNATVEAGDKYYEYHGIPNMFLHVFTRAELVRELRRAGFTVAKVIPLSVERRTTLARPWLLGRLRAGGWIVVCHHSALRGT